MSGEWKFVRLLTCTNICYTADYYQVMLWRRYLSKLFSENVFKSVIHILVFWIMSQCIVVRRHPYFAGRYCPHVQKRRQNLYSKRRYWPTTLPGAV